MRIINVKPDVEIGIVNPLPANQSNIMETPPPLINTRVPELNMLHQCLIGKAKDSVFYQWGLQWGNGDDSDTFGLLLRYPDKRPDYITEVVPLPEDKSVLWIWVVDSQYYDFVPRFDYTKFIDLRNTGIFQIGLRSIDDVKEFLKKFCNKIKSNCCCK